MPTGMSAFVAEGFLNAVFNATPLSVAEVWIQLHIGDPGAAGTTNPATETTRKQLSSAAASGPSITSDAALEWPSIAGSQDPTHWSAWTAAAAGTYLGSGEITSAAYVAGNTFRVPTSDFDLTVPVAS